MLWRGDIEIEGERGKDDGLKHYLGVWLHSPFPNFSTSRFFHFRMRYLRHFCRDTSNDIPYVYEGFPLHSSNNFCKIKLHRMSWYLLNLQCNTPNSVPSSRTDVPEYICVRKPKFRPFIRDNVRHQRCQVVYIIWLPLYPSIFITPIHNIAQCVQRRKGRFTASNNCRFQLIYLTRYIEEFNVHVRFISRAR